MAVQKSLNRGGRNLGVSVCNFKHVGFLRGKFFSGAFREVFNRWFEGLSPASSWSFSPARSSAKGPGTEPWASPRKIENKLKIQPGKENQNLNWKIMSRCGAWPRPCGGGKFPWRKCGGGTLWKINYRPGSFRVLQGWTLRGSRLAPAKCPAKCVTKFLSVPFHPHIVQTPPYSLRSFNLLYHGIELQTVHINVIKSENASVCVLFDPHMSQKFSSFFWCVFPEQYLFFSWMMSGYN